MAKLNSFKKNMALKFGRLLTDKAFLKLRYRLTFKKKLNLKNPTTYNEKLQWMKLYDKNDLYTSLVDKYEVKDYVAKKIGNEFVIPTIGVWDKFEDIDFDFLPSQFVLKCTHDSGSVIICKDKSTIDMPFLRKHFHQCLKTNSYLGGREWAYKNVKPRIIAEPFLTDDSRTGLKDYKFFCFNGKVKALFIATDRGVEGKEVKFDFFDEHFNHLPFRHGHKNALVTPSKPLNFEEMVMLAEKLAHGLRHVRIDLYNIGGEIKFGEMTFYHHCGFVPFDPEEWDYKFGQWLSLDKNV